MARSTFVAAKEETPGAETPVQAINPLVAHKSFVPPVAPLEYGKRLRKEGVPVYYCTSAEMERGWRM